MSDAPTTPDKNGEISLRSLVDMKKRETPKDTTKLKDSQLEVLNNLWKDKEIDPPSIPELIKAAWGKDFDISSKEGLLIRRWVANQSKSKAAQQINQPAPKPKIELNDVQKCFIENNAYIHNILKITRDLFSNPNLSPFSIEYRSVKDYVNTIKIRDGRIDPEPQEEDDDTVLLYKAPTAMVHILSRIKKYVNIFQKVETKDLSIKERRNCESLISYMNALRFIRTIESFSDIESRELFESNFVRCCYDKPDLTEEEVDQYIIYSNEVVISRKIQKSIDIFQKRLEEDLDDVDKKLSLTLVEAIGKMRDEYNQSIKRQQDLLKDLKVKRSERLSKQVRDNASVLNLVEVWKNEEFRKKTIHLAIKRQEKLRAGVQHLSSMDEVKAKIFGISEEEVLNG